MRSFGYGEKMREEIMIRKYCMKNIFSIKGDHKMTWPWVDLVSPNPKSPTVLTGEKENKDKAFWTLR